MNGLDGGLVVAVMNCLQRFRRGLSPAFLLLIRLSEHLNVEPQKLIKQIAYKRAGQLDKKRLFDDKQKARIYKRDNGVCFHCQEKVERKAAAFDHVIAWSCGGKTVVKNGVVACISCNSKKKDNLFFVV